ncbi:MAG: hypothetical protein ACO3UU_16445 [Minisyncoccia bacterium]
MKKVLEDNGIPLPEKPSCEDGGIIIPEFPEFSLPSYLDKTLVLSRNKRIQMIDILTNYATGDISIDDIPKDVLESIKENDIIVKTLFNDTILSINAETSLVRSNRELMYKHIELRNKLAN